MNIKKWIVATSAAVGMAASFSASAAQIEVVIWQGQNTYMGQFYNAPTEPFGAQLAGRVISDQNVFFQDYWIFEYIPGGSGDFSVNFNPDGGISGFTGALYQAAPTGCVAGGTCATAGLGTKVTDFYAVSSGIGFVEPLSAGFYALYVTGTTVPKGFYTSNYTGQITFKEVPEPGSLALLGLGLVGAGLARRRKIS